MHPLWIMVLVTVSDGARMHVSAPQVTLGDRGLWTEPVERSDYAETPARAGPRPRVTRSDVPPGGARCAGPCYTSPMTTNEAPAPYTTTQATDVAVMLLVRKLRKIDGGAALAQVLAKLDE